MGNVLIGEELVYAYEIYNPSEFILDFKFI